MTESQIISAVRRFLESNGFQVTRTLSEVEHGIDIEAIAPDRVSNVSIEAKGETSSKVGTARFGKPFNSGQVFDHVSKAFYCAARDSSIGLLAGVAFPHNEVHVKCVDKILPALKKLGIEVFWVHPDGTVDIAHVWNTWNEQQ